MTAEMTKCPACGYRRGQLAPHCEQCRLPFEFWPDFDRGQRAIDIIRRKCSGRYEYSGAAREQWEEDCWGLIAEADAALLARGYFDNPAERDRCFDRYTMERASLVRRDAYTAAHPVLWPPSACSPDECGFAAMQIAGGRLCRQMGCRHLNTGEGT